MVTIRLNYTGGLQDVRCHHNSNESSLIPGKEQKCTGAAMVPVNADMKARLRANIVTEVQFNNVEFTCGHKDIVVVRK